MPWKPPSNLRIFSRCRNARATRMAYRVASVPVEQKRTFSAHGIAFEISSARRIACSLFAKNVEPRSSCSRTAATTSGCACPTSIGPDPRR